MGQLGGLTNTGVTDPNGGPMQWMNQGQIQSGQLAKALTPQVGSLQPQDSVNPGNAPNMPQAIHPSFAQAASMGATPGDANVMSPALSKMGKLGVFLTSGLKGAMAGEAASANAVMQSGGRRGGNFGSGFEAAQSLPWQQALQQQEVQRGAIQNQAAQMNLQPIQTPWGSMPLGRAQAMAGLQKDVSDIQAKGFVTPRGGGVYDTRTQSYAPGAAPTPQRPTDPAEQTFAALTTTPDPTLGRPLTADEAYQRINAEKKSGTATPTAAQDDERYETIIANQKLGNTVAPQDQAFAAAYEKRKTLGPATSSAAADARQANTEQFQQQEAGRKYLSEKVEGPYIDAREKADNLRGIVQAAQGGSMIAGSLQPLLATLGVTTMEGVKRINSTELAQVSGAGDLWTRIKGSVGKLKEGQPIAPALQKDIVNLAGMLEQSAYKKYSDGFGRTKQRYGLTDEQPIGAPSNGGQIQVKDPIGGVHTFPDQASANKFKQAAGIQ